MQKIDTTSQETREALEQLHEMQLKKIQELPRKEKRAKLRIRHGAIDRPHARVRSGSRTGTSAHFAEWKAANGVRSALQRTKLDKLADALNNEERPNLRLASTIAIIRVNSPIKSVWDLARSDLSTLLAIPQIGPARLETVEKYLRGQNVVVDWTVA